MAEKKVGYTIEYRTLGAKTAASDAKLVAGSMEDLVAKFNRGDWKNAPKVVSDLESKLRNANFGAGLGGIASKAQEAGKASEDAAKTAGNASKLASYQSKQLAFQINDVVAQLSTGAPVWRIAMQQGGQVTQIYGGVAQTFAALLPKIIAFAPAVAGAVTAMRALRGINAGREAAKSITELADQADRAKVSIEQLQKFTAAGAGNGVGSDQIVSSLAAVSSAGLKAAEDQKKYYQDLDAAEANVRKGVAGAREELDKLNNSKPSDIFTQLGVSMTNFNGRADESIPLIRRMADRLAAMPDGIRKTQFVRLAEESFGQGFTKVLLGGSKGIDAYERKLDSLVPKLSAPEVAAAKAEISLSGLLDAAKKRAEDQYGAAFLPAANALDKYLISSFKKNADSVRGFADEVRAFFDILNGNTEEAAKHPALKLIADGYSRLVKITEGLGSAASKGFSALAKGADGAFDSLNKVFGTNFDAGSAALVAAIGGMVIKFTPLGAVIGAIGGSFIALAATVAATSLVIYAYSDKIAAGIKNFATNAVTDAKIRTAQQAADHMRALGDKEAAAKQDAIAAQLLRQRENELADQRKKQAENDKYKGMTGAQEFAARISEAMNDSAKLVGGAWDKIVATAGGAGAGAGAKIADGIKKGAADGAAAAKAELDRVEKAAASTEGRIIKGSRLENVSIPKDGQPSEPRLIKGANIGAIDTAARFKDKPGREGIDNAIGLGKVEIDQIEKIKAGKREIAQPTQIAVDASQVEKAAQTVQTVADGKKSIEGRIIKGSAVTATDIPVEQPAQAVAQKTAEASANLGTASTNAQTMAQNVQGAASATDTAAASATRLADEYRRAADAASAIKPPSGGAAPTGGDGSTPLAFADGGYVTGAGTGTSDSILSWLSNKEFVVRSAIVQKPGVLGFLRALNGGLNLPSVFGKRGFAAGGLVGAVPAIAAGVGGGQPVHVHFDGVSIGPMSASKSVVDQLLREEAKSRVSRAGRAPSRVG